LKLTTTPLGIANCGTLLSYAPFLGICITEVAELAQDAIAAALCVQKGARLASVKPMAM